MLHPTPTPRSVRTTKPGKNVNLLSQALRVLHQRVNIDVDLASSSILGFTEITVIPTVGNLRTVAVDCREMEVLAVYVNRKIADFTHNDCLYINKLGDPLRSTSYNRYKTTGDASVNVYDLYDKNMSLQQVQILRLKLGYIFGESNDDPRDGFELFQQQQFNTEELTVFIPESVKLELVDLSLAANNIAGGQLLQTPATGTPSRHKGTLLGDTYSPITIKIEYRLINPKNGVNFINHYQDKRKWHVYTTNSDLSVSTSSWVPCIDNLWERSTWTLEVSIPRKVQDIGGQKANSQSTRKSDLKVSASVSTNENPEPGEKPKPVKFKNDTSDEKDEDRMEEDDDDDDDDDNENDINICTGDFSNVKEVPHTTDPSKKVVLWSIFNPICAQHVGWAIGNFEALSLPNLKQGTSQEEDMEDGTYEEMEEKEATDTPFMAYCLPGERELVINSVIFMNRALDFYLREFGSFPFGSYAMVFVEETLCKNSYDFAGISVCSSRLLYNADLIEPMVPSTEEFLESLALQWSGINVVPQTFNEIWCTIGIARYMALQFIKVLMGVNEYRFRVKLRINEIIDADVGRKPIGFTFFRSPVLTNDLDFVKLKAPIVLYILDKRMTKTDKSFGLSRVLPKIFLQAMSGDLPNGSLSVLHFQTVCEKVARHKLDPFFKQWVYGCGTPIFNITQKFNKKKMMIEMYIRQVQLKEARAQHPRMDTFLNDSVAFIEDEPSFPVQQAFTGPMTIRVHEADGVPYEHVIEIKEGAAKYDVQYNTKFRRMKKKEREEAMANGIEITGPLNIPTTGEAQPYEKLGDVLTSPSDMQEWGFADWPKRDEEEKEADAFEWIRVDADFEWIARFYVQQPDYMYALQLMHDRDVEAQYDAIKYFGDREKPNIIYCSMLARTAMDNRYYYGVRIAACQALADFSNSDNNFIGRRFLMNIYKKLFCFHNSSIPLSNTFENFPTFYLQRALPNILCNIRDQEGKVSNATKRLLINLVKFNDNSDNEFNDCFYISNLLSALTTSFLVTGGINQIRDELSEKNDPMLKEVITEIGRLQKLDEWIPSYQSVLLVTCLRQRIRLAMYGLILFLFEDFLVYTLKKHSTDMRIEAFRGLLILGGLKNAAILRYFLKTLLLDTPSPYFRTGLIEVLKEVISIAAIHGTPSTLDDPEFNTLEKYLNSNLGHSGDSLGASLGASTVVIEDGASKSDSTSRRDAFARATTAGAISILRRDYAVGKGLQEVIWELLHTSLLSTYEKRTIFTIAEVLYYSKDSFILLIPIPSLPIDELKRKFVVRLKKMEGHLMVLIKREGRNKIQLGGPRKTEETSTAAAPNATSSVAIKSTPSLVPVLSNATAPTAPVLKLKPLIKIPVRKEEQPNDTKTPATPAAPKLKVTIKNPSASSSETTTPVPKSSSNFKLAKAPTTSLKSIKGKEKPGPLRPMKLVNRDVKNKFLLTFTLPIKKLIKIKSSASNRNTNTKVTSVNGPKFSTNVSPKKKVSGPVAPKSVDLKKKPLVSVTGTTVKFKFTKRVDKVEKKTRRYVKIDLFAKRVFTSSQPFNE